MDVQENAIRVLAFIYKKKKTSEGEIRDESGLTERITRKSIQFLLDRGLATSQFRNISGELRGLMCTPDAIALLESPPGSDARRGMIAMVNLTTFEALATANLTLLVHSHSVFNAPLA